LTPGPHAPSGPTAATDVAARRAIVLAGGRGTRLRPYTAVIPKPLMPVGDRPVLDIVIRQLQRAGFERVTIATGYLAELVEAFFGDGSRYGLQVDYVHEEEPLGTVGALAFIDDLDAPFLVMNGDVLTDLDYGALVSRHAATDAIATIAVTTSRIDVSLGVIHVDEHDRDRLVDYVEKPALDVEASMGVYCFSPRVLDHIVPGEHLDFPDLILRLLERGEVVRGWRPRAYWLDIGRHEDHERAVREFERNRSRFIPGEPHLALERPRVPDVPPTPVRGGRARPRALVTGGAGFIGSHLVDALVAEGYRVAALDDLSTGRRENLASDVRLHRVDVSDLEALDRVFAAERPNVVFHLAGQLDVRISVASPSLDANVNVCGTAAVLEAARLYGADRVVLASTGGALYGEADVLPTPESAPIRPMSPYGTSKAAAEAYCALYTRLHALSTASLRLANVYGPRQDPHGEAGVIAAFCLAALNGRHATVYGDGRQTRDFLYVDDAVAAFLAAGDARTDGPFNVGTGIETSVLELVEALELVAHHQPKRLGEVARSCLDSSLALERLSWRASTPLLRGLQETMAWARGALTHPEPMPVRSAR
jgi:nucleoside-diphosphate-sugar epimerase/dTDP-glucose pyrophosphorylase